MHLRKSHVCTFAFLMLMVAGMFLIETPPQSKPSEIEVNWEEQPQQAATSLLTFKTGQRMITARDYNITSLAVGDFRKYQWDGDREEGLDLVLGYTDGYISTYEGMAASPFQAWTPPASMNMQISTTKVLMALPSKIVTDEGSRTHIFAITDANAFIAYYNRLGGASDSYFTPAQWASPASKIAVSTYLSGETITAVVQTDIMAPCISNQYVVGTQTGKLALIRPTQNRIDLNFNQTVIHTGNSSFSVKAVQVCDINVDSNWDILALYSNGTLRAYLGNKASLYTNWTNKVDIDTTAGITNFIVADLNNDAFDDIIGTTAAGTVKFWQNDYLIADGFANEFSKNTLGQIVNDIHAADFDRDGDQDLAFATNNGSIVILENDYNYHASLVDTDKRELWTSLPSHYLDATWLSGVDGNYATTSLEIADLDEDGWPDIISGHQHGRVYGWENNNKTQVNPFILGYPTKIVSKIAGYQLKDYAVGDIDRDGDMDVVAAYNSVGNAKIYAYLSPGSKKLYSGEGFTRKMLPDPPGVVKNIELRDLDHDGDLDIVYSLYASSDGYHHVCAIKNNYANTTGRFIDMQWTDTYYNLFKFPETSVMGTVAMNDFNMDGDIDYLSMAQTGLAYGYGPIDGNNPFLTSTYSNDPNNGKLILTTSVANQITGIKTGNFEGYKSTNPVNYALNIDDIVVTDFYGNVYYMPGQYQLSEFSRDDIIDKYGAKRVFAVNPGNTSTTGYGTIDSMFLAQDKYYRRPAVVVGGAFGGESLVSRTRGYIATIGKTSLMDLESWTFIKRVDHYKPIYDLRNLDMNQDGTMDTVFRDLAGDLYVAECNHTYVNGFINGGSFPVRKLAWKNETNFNIVPGGIKIADFDADGDEDLIVSDDQDNIYFMRNALDDDVDTHFLSIDVTPSSSADSVVISVAVNDSAKKATFTPQLKVLFDDGSAEYPYPMEKDVDGKNYHYNYIIPRNGTYTAIVNASDQWNNLGIVSKVFYGDQDPPGLTATLKQYCNGSFEVYIYNNTNPVEPVEKIGVNVTVPIVGMKYFECNFANVYTSSPLNNTLYYMKNNTWWMRFSKCDYNGLYKVGINATDRFELYYRHVEKQIINDIALPALIIIDGITKPLNPTELTLAAPQIPFIFNFTEDISYLRYWVENPTSGENVMYDVDMVEAWNIGRYYISQFRAKQDGDLNLRILLVDIAGNSKVYNYSFYLNPILIQFIEAWFYVISEDGSKETTYQNYAFVHFKGDFVYEFRLRYDGLNESVNGLWTEWKEYNIYQTEYYHERDPTRGYKIYFKEKSYGMKDIELEFRNPHHTISCGIRQIEYAEVERVSFPWMYLLYIGAVGLGIGAIVGLSKRYRGSNEWKKYMNHADVVKFDED